MRRGPFVLLCAVLASCGASTGDDVRPTRDEVLDRGSDVLVALPDGSIVIEEDGRLLSYDPNAADARPVVVGPATEVGEVHAAVPMDGAILVLASGGTFILRDAAWVPSPLAGALEGTIEDAILLPTPTGRGQGDLWIATTSALYRVVDGVAERFSLDESLEGVQLAQAARPEGPALWVRLGDRVLEVWRDRSGVIRSAALLLERAPEEVAGDANLDGWLVMDGGLFSIGADRRLVDHGVSVARLLASPLSREVWIVSDDGDVWLHADGALHLAPEIVVDPAQTMAVAADGSLYVSADTIVRYAPRRRAALSGVPDGSLLATPSTFVIEAEGAPSVEATIDGEAVDVAADPLRVELDPVALGEGSHELVVRIAYDDGTLPTTDRRRFEVITGATWSEDVAPLMDLHCAACHGPGGSAVTRLGSREEWEHRIEVIVQNVDQGRMPLGRPPLTRREVALIQAWQVGGFAE